MSDRVCAVAPPVLETIAERAYLYTVPLIVMETTRKRRLLAGANVFNHARKLLNHRSRTVTTPNNDTLYSDAWLDLASGPVTITVPPTGERYFSLAFMDMYTNNFAILGTRTTGGAGGTYTIVGPDQALPSGAQGVVRAPTPRVWALARILVDDADDLPVARQLQNELFIHEGVTTDDIAPGEPVTRGAPWAEYFRAANRLLARERPPVTDERILANCAPLGIGPNQPFDPDRFSDEQAQAIERGIERARALLIRMQGDQGDVIQGWTYPSPRNGDYGQHYTLRAMVSIGTLGALPPEEALYMRAHGDRESGLFDGGQDHVLHFPSGEMPPLESFWSLSLYEATTDGRFFFADTPLQRYAIGDRTPGLTWNDDGSLDIWIGSRSPGGKYESNWLPAPEGSFALFFRGYIPEAALLDGRYRLPPIAPA